VFESSYVCFVNNERILFFLRSIVRLDIFDILVSVEVEGRQRDLNVEILECCEGKVSEFLVSGWEDKVSEFLAAFRIVQMCELGYVSDDKLWFVFVYRSSECVSVF
jgi:hypothetical protein